MDIPLKGVYKRKKLKKICQFPGCGCEFMGVGPAKYCEEHKKTKHRPFLNKLIKEKKESLLPKQENCNQEIKHNYSVPTKVNIECGLEGCCNTFDITLLPRTYVYPKFCQEHVNSYKRELFRKNNETKI